MSGDEDEIKSLKERISEAGRGRRFLSGDEYLRFVELDPEAAASSAQYWHDFYVDQRCDVMHLPINMLTREELDLCKDAADSAVIVRAGLVNAGAAAPRPTTCRHGKAL